MRNTPNPASGNIQYFKSGARKALTVALLCVIIAIALAIWSHAKGILSWSGVISGVGLMGTFCSGLSFLMGIQRVEINSDKGTIRFSNAQTAQLWRELRLGDVTSIRWVEGGVGNGYTNCLLLDLAPAAAERKRNVMELSNPTDTFPPKAPLLFLAVVDAVRTVNPSVKVDLSGGFGRQPMSKTPAGSRSRT